MANGRIHAIVVATDGGNVVYERFYDNTSESTRAEIRAAFWQSRSVMGRKGEEGHCYVGNYKGGSIVFIPIGDIVFYAMGSGDYDELALHEVLETLIASLRDVLTRPPTEALILENYPAVCLSVDEIIIEGIYHNNDKDIIRKATKMKVPWET